jgi:hypothetical protein
VGSNPTLCIYIKLSSNTYLNLIFINIIFIIYIYDSNDEQIYFFNEKDTFDKIDILINKFSDTTKKIKEKDIQNINRYINNFLTNAERRLRLNVSSIRGINKPTLGNYTILFGHNYDHTFDEFDEDETRIKKNIEKFNEYYSRITEIIKNYENSNHPNKIMLEAINLVAITKLISIYEDTIPVISEAKIANNNRRLGLGLQGQLKYEINNAEKSKEIINSLPVELQDKLNDKLYDIAPSTEASIKWRLEHPYRKYERTKKQPTEKTYKNDDIPSIRTNRGGKYKKTKRKYKKKTKKLKRKYK